MYSRSLYCGGEINVPRFFKNFAAAALQFRHVNRHSFVGCKQSFRSFQALSAMFRGRQKSRRTFPHLDFHLDLLLEIIFLEQARVTLAIDEKTKLINFFGETNRSISLNRLNKILKREMRPFEKFLYTGKQSSFRNLQMSADMKCRKEETDGCDRRKIKVSAIKRPFA